MPSSDKQVDFKEIEILEFHYVIGDNPACTAGCPIALGTELVGKMKCDVDYFENNRGKRKNRKKLILPVPTRAQILMERGYSINEIADGTMEADRARQERHITNSTQKWDKVNEMSERFGRVLRKAMLSGGAKKLTVVANTA